MRKTQKRRSAGIKLGFSVSLLINYITPIFMDILALAQPDHEKVFVYRLSAKDWICISASRPGWRDKSEKTPAAYRE